MLLFVLFYNGEKLDYGLFFFIKNQNATPNIKWT